MSTYSIRLYQSEYQDTWDRFVRSAKNTSFLYYRKFMEYHSNRFVDYSLMIFKKDKLQAVLPANIKEGKLYSHQGLTYGGLIFSEKLKFREIFVIVQQLLIYLDKEGIALLEIKNIPSFYCNYPSEELDYLYFLLNAKINRVDLASVIDLRNPLPIQKNRLEGVKKAKKQGLKIEKTSDFSAFWNDILIPNLSKAHDTKPVHTLEEITLLQQSFPEHIHQFNVISSENKIVAGTTIFETAQVAHVQYISADKNKQQLGSLDFLFQHLITSVFKHKRYFDFGTSNENAGRNLNAGLQYWKESYGGRGQVYRTFQIKTSNYKNLENTLL